MKATKATVQARVEEVLAIRLDGAEFWSTREYAQEKEKEEGSVWHLAEGQKPLSDGQLWRYLGRADKLIAESCRASRKKLLRRHLAQRRNLYAKAVSQGDVRAALACLDSEAKLLGLSEDEITRQLDSLQKQIAETKANAQNHPPPALAQLQMDLATLASQESPAVARLRVDPALILADAGMEPDLWQSECLRTQSRRQLLLCSRQSGKSQTAAALALRTALLKPGSLTLLLSPTLRQSGELFRDKVKRLYGNLNRPVATVQLSALTMELANGSRIISLPGEEGSIRGYSAVSLLVIDEAARVDDTLYHSVRPMLATSQGTLIALSTPFGRRGWFYDTWQDAEPWHRIKITADQCPRITPEFLAEERQAIGERWYNQEYGCEFLSAIGAMFSGDDIDAMFTANVEPLEFTA